jgi:hypothetical protein
MQPKNTKTHHDADVLEPMSRAKAPVRGDANATLMLEPMCPRAKAP